MIRVKYSKFSKELIYLRKIYGIKSIALTRICNNYNFATNIKYNKDCILEKNKVDLEVMTVRFHINKLKKFLLITPVNTLEYKSKMLDFIDNQSPILLNKVSSNIKIWRCQFNKIDLEFLKKEHYNLNKLYNQLNIEL